MNIEEQLSQRLNLPQVRDVALWATGRRDHLRRLWHYACSGHRTTSLNALWSITHLPESDSEWILTLRDDMIGRLLSETDNSRKRLLLKILREQEYDAETIRTDFLDFCMARINSECEPYAIRCSCLYAAFRMCRHYPELLAELNGHLDMLALQPLSPGLKSALRQTKSKIRKLKIE